MVNIICLYCGKRAELVNGATVYPHIEILHAKMFYLCSPCDAYVGCHPGTNKPLGVLANAETRKARSEAHKYFDALWRNVAIGRRAEYRRMTYEWLAEKLGINRPDCHIAHFDIAMCARVVSICKVQKEV